MNKIYTVLVFILSLILSIAFFVFKDFFKGTESLGLLGVFIVNFISSAALFVSGPAFLTIIAGGILYSPILVAIIASFGAALGDMIGFLFGHSGRRLARKKFEKNLKILFLEKHFKKHGDLIILTLAIIPNPFFDAIGIFAGVLNYSPVRFFILIFIGRFVRYWLLAQFGSTLK